MYRDCTINVFCVSLKYFGLQHNLLKKKNNLANEIIVTETDLFGNKRPYCIHVEMLCLIYSAGMQWRFHFTLSQFSSKKYTRYFL